MISLLFASAMAFGANNLHYPVRCADSAACPTWVAGLRTKNSVCSAALVRPDLIVTNRHCLPSDLQHDGADCSDKLAFFFPATEGLPTKKAECDRVQSVSAELSEGTMSPDFAFLRLKDSVDRPVLPYSRQGLADQAMFRIYVIDPESSGGVVRLKRCEATQNTIVNPYFSNNLSPVITFAKCQIRQGNSGSPIVALDGTLRGILNARSEIPFAGLALAKKQIGQAESAHGTNFSCLEKDVLDSAVPDAKACFIRLDEESQQALSKKMIEDKVSAAMDELVAKVNESGRKLLSMDRAFFHWTPENNKDEKLRRKERSYLVSVGFKPRCLVPGVKKIADMRDRLKKTPVSFDVETPSYDLHQGVDEDLHFQVEVREVKTKDRVTLTPMDLLKRKNIDLKIERIQPESDLGPRSLALNLCYP